MALQTFRRAVGKHYPLLSAQIAQCVRPSTNVSRPTGLALVGVHQNANFSTVDRVEGLLMPTIPLLQRAGFNEHVRSVFLGVTGLPGSLWLSSVIKKRRKKMNKHKLRKLRKKNRYKNKNS